MDILSHFFFYILLFQYMFSRIFLIVPLETFKLITFLYRLIFLLVSRRAFSSVVLNVAFFLQLLQRSDLHFAQITDTGLFSCLHVLQPGSPSSGSFAESISSSLGETFSKIKSENDLEAGRK